LAEQAQHCGEAVGETLRDAVSGLLHVANMAQERQGVKGENWCEMVGWRGGLEVDMMALTHG
jgi:hypothetical protein